MNRLLFSLLVVMIMSGCASTYKPILPNQLNYDMDGDSSGVKFGYRYEVLNYRGNRKYAKHERKKMIRVVAVKIENNTDVTLKLGENFNIYLGQNLIYPIDPVMVQKDLRQRIGWYLFYSLITLNKTECDPNTGLCESTLLFPIGIPITIGNMVVGGSANKQFKNELLQYNLVNKEIEPGKTAYALIGIPDTGFQPLKLVMKYD